MRRRNGTTPQLTGMTMNDIRTASRLLLLTCVMLISPFVFSEELKVDNLLLNGFKSNEPDLQWYVQNDTVMGGRSEGGFSIVDEELLFSGVTNTNGGGFSSIRTQRFIKDLSGYSGIKLRVKADGRKYTWSIQTDARWRGRQVSYWADFKTIAGELEEIYIPFTEFAPQFRGFELDGPSLDLSNISEFALYQYDKTDGAFELKLLSVEAYNQ